MLSVKGKGEEGRFAKIAHQEEEKRTILHIVSITFKIDYNRL